MDQQAFREKRREGIGASDIGAIMGVDPFRTPHDVFMEKLGLADFEPNEAMQTGNDIEEWIVTQRYTPLMEKAGQKVGVIKPARVLRPSFPYMYCHPDGLVVDRSVTLDGLYWDRSDNDDTVGLPIKKILCGVEVKNVGEYRGKEFKEPGTADVPLSYVYQCQYSMGITGLDRWDLAAFIGGNKFRLYHIQKDTALIKRIYGEVELFWQRVLNNDPPEIDGSQGCNQFLNKFYKPVDGECADITVEIDKVVRDYLALREKEKLVAAEILKHENVVCNHLKEAEEMFGTDWKVTWKLPKSKQVTNWEALCMENLSPKADLIEHYTEVKPPKKRTFRACETS